MLPLKDAVSILPQITLAAAGAVVSNSTAANASPATTAAFVGTNTAASSLNDAAAGFLLSLLMPGKNGSARTLHKILVASNLFWYQTIRQTVAVLSVFMCQEFAGSMDTVHQAKLIAAPSAGNIFTQAIGGLVISCLPGGTKSAITIAMMSLATGCTLLPFTIPGPLSNGAFSLEKAFALLTLQGALFGPMFPAHSVLLSKWLPPNERGSAMAYGEIAVSVASMVVPLVITSVAEYTAKPIAVAATEAAAASSTVIKGWRNGFYASGLACFGYLVVWMVLGRKDPESCSYISKEELKLIQSVQTKSVGSKRPKRKSDLNESGGTSLPPHRIILHPSVLSLFFVHMAYNFVTLSLNSWMPTYYNDVLKLNPSEAKVHIILPQLAALLVKLCVSKLARILRNSVRNKSVNSSNNDGKIDERSVLLFSRRFMSNVGFTVMALPLSLLPMAAPLLVEKASPASPSPSPLSSVHSLFSSSPWWSTGLFSAALAGTGFHAESFRANYLDVTEKHVALVAGVGNCLSSVCALTAPFIIGGILRKTSGDWSPVWRLSALSAISAGVVFAVFSTTTPVEEQ